MDLFDTRKNYDKATLDIVDLNKNPLVQTQEWLKEAEEEKCLEHSAVTLSTVSAKGQPSSRMVLIKKVDKQGLYFFTNYDSRKAQQLEKNNCASLLLFWPKLERQIQIEGTVQKCSERLSELYFESRPIGSQISAIASLQSKQVDTREAMITTRNKVAEVAKEHKLKRPYYWGGYLFTPTRFEFWQGGPDRFHDRILFEMENSEWSTKRLMP